MTLKEKTYNETMELLMNFKHKAESGEYKEIFQNNNNQEAIRHLIESSRIKIDQRAIELSANCVMFGYHLAMKDKPMSDEDRIKKCLKLGCEYLVTKGNHFSCKLQRCKYD